MINVNTKTKSVIVEVVLDGIVTLKARDDVSIDLWDEEEEVRFYMTRVEQKNLPEIMQVLNQNSFVIDNLFPIYEHPDGNELNDAIIVAYTLHVFCKFKNIKTYLEIKHV